MDCEQAMQLALNMKNTTFIQVNVERNSERHRHVVGIDLGIDTDTDMETET